MFSKTAKSSKQQASRSVGEAPSIISSGLTVAGDLISEGEIQVDGKVNGDIRAGNVAIGEGASVNGKIAANEVLVRGTINGEVRAESVHLAATAKVTGDIIHKELAIETGAYLEGHCRRIDQSSPSAGKTGNGKAENTEGGIVKDKDGKAAPAKPAASANGRAADSRG